MHGVVRRDKVDKLERNPDVIPPLYNYVHDKNRVEIKIENMESTLNKLLSEFSNLSDRSDRTISDLHEELSHSNSTIIKKINAHIKNTEKIKSELKRELHNSQPQTMFKPYFYNSTFKTKISTTNIQKNQIICDCELLGLINDSLILYPFGDNLVNVSLLEGEYSIVLITQDDSEHKFKCTLKSRVEKDGYKYWVVFEDTLPIGEYRLIIDY